MSWQLVDSSPSPVTSLPSSSDDDDWMKVSHLETASSSAARRPQDEVLVDISTDNTDYNHLFKYSSKTSANNSINNKQYALLDRAVTGWDFNLKTGEALAKIQLQPGTLLVNLDPNLDSRIMNTLRSKEMCNKDAALMKDAENVTQAALIFESNIMRIDSRQASLLKGIPKNRLKVYRDFQRFIWIDGLKPGSKVEVEVFSGDGVARRVEGEVRWKGELQPDAGLFFGVRVQEPQGNMNGFWEDRRLFDAPPRGGLLVDASALHRPSSSRQHELSNGLDTFESNARAPVERIVPIRIIEKPERSVERIRQEEETALRVFDGDYEVPQLEPGVRPVPRPRVSRQTPQRLDNESREWKSDTSFQIHDREKCCGWKLGDRCVWKKGREKHRATIRFIGYLRGHSSVYAGVEFDEAVGEGTGMYQGEELFRTKSNHAGYLLISNLIRPSPPPTPPSPVAGPLIDIPSMASEMPSHSYDVVRPSTPPVPPPPKVSQEYYLLDKFSTGSCVEVCYNGSVRHGVVEWVGDLFNRNSDRLEKTAAVRLEEDNPVDWDVALDGVPMGTQRALFTSIGVSVLVPLHSLRNDRRFVSSEPMVPEEIDTRATQRVLRECLDSGVEKKKCEPTKQLDALAGKMKGIQGHLNSCYIDATLYALFVQSTAFDFLIERAASPADLPEYEEIVRVIATEIVYPLRKFHFVRADHVMKLRELLSLVLPISGLTKEEKDPEEILPALFKTIFRAKPFLEIRGQDAKKDKMYICPLIVDSDWQFGPPTTQHLLDRSMLSGSVRMVAAPNVLILQLPRYGQQKLFKQIVPLQQIDVTPLLHNVAQPCYSCSRIAEVICRECLLLRPVTMAEVTFCTMCHSKAHSSSGPFAGHLGQPLPSVPVTSKLQQYRMSLSAVLCIETSHYVSFVKSLAGKWLFFDSMADRHGLSDGYNVPEVRVCEKAASWLTLSGWDRLRSSLENGRFYQEVESDPLLLRLLSDSYFCIYCAEPVAPVKSSSAFNLFNK